MYMAADHFEGFTFQAVLLFIKNKMEKKRKNQAIFVQKNIFLQFH